ncbi:DNA-binding protein, partial [bacterium]
MYKRDSAGATASFEGGELVIRVRVDGAAGSNGEEWVDVLSVVPLPRKRVASACRRGELRAVKHGSKWLAKRRDVDAFL